MGSQKHIASVMKAKLMGGGAGTQHLTTSPPSSAGAVAPPLNTSLSGDSRPAQTTTGSAVIQLEDETRPLIVQPGGNGGEENSPARLQFSLTQQQHQHQQQLQLRSSPVKSEIKAEMKTEID